MSFSPLHRNAVGIKGPHGRSDGGVGGGASPSVHGLLTVLPIDTAKEQTQVYHLDIVKLVFFADLHLDAPFAWLGGSQLAARRRRQALRETLGTIVRLADVIHADALLCAGDLFEQARYTPDTAAFLERSFEEIEPMSVFLAPGNHDWYGTESPYRQARWSPNVHIFTEDRLRPVPLRDGLTLWGAAHRSPARTLGFLDDFRGDRGGIHLALFHSSERGGFPLDEPATSRTHRSTRPRSSRPASITCWPVTTIGRATPSGTPIRATRTSWRSGRTANGARSS